MNEISSLISPFLQRLDQQLLNYEFEQDDQSIVASTLQSLRGVVSQHLVNSDNEECQLAFEFGCEIANGIDETWSDGTPRTSPPNPSDDGNLSRVVWRFENPSPPKWEWFDECRLRQVASRLHLDRRLFVPEVPNYENMIDLRHLPTERFWGWFAIESALQRIQQEGLRFPQWDAESRALYVGHTLVRQFNNRRSNQIKIVEAFAEEGWPASIANPLSHARQKTDTIRDLNNSIEPQLIRFFGTGDTGVMWNLTSDENSEE